MESKPTFNKFDDVDHMELRVFNRTILMNNLIQDHGVDAGAEYAELFSENERTQMLYMNMYISANGYNKARDFATKDLVLQDDVEVLEPAA